MADVAILIDGSDEPVRGGRVDFPVGAVARPRRPLTGVAIALVTAVVTMGATGPQPADMGTVAENAPAACTDAAKDLALGEPAAAGTAEPWWGIEGPTRWVDPQTGMTVQVDLDSATGLVDHRVRDR